MKNTRIFTDVIDGKALDQFYDAMKQPFVIRGALMPDTHAGYSLPIGAVVATEGTIVPAWVGYDIGCGMCAFKTGFDKQFVTKYGNNIFEDIYEKIPVGANVNQRPTQTRLQIDSLSKAGQKCATEKKWRHALGSLGGGNHFIEIGYDTDDAVWIIIHSGSRGVGHAIASHYMALASVDPSKLEAEFESKHQEMKKHAPEGVYDQALAKYIKKVQGKARPKEGHFGLDVNTHEGRDYINDMSWALDFALENRKEMMNRILKIMANYAGTEKENLEDSLFINRNHNHATNRLVDGKDAWIHRKGATHSEVGMYGVIPGNMRDGSFIVIGKGNPESMWSSSHGAGRVLGRREAKEKIDYQDFVTEMDNSTLVAGKIDHSTIDESPFAYKDIFKVMSDQADLVEVVTHVKPLINVKG